MTTKILSMPTERTYAPYVKQVKYPNCFHGCNVGEYPKHVSGNGKRYTEWRVLVVKLAAKRLKIKETELQSYLRVFRIKSPTGNATKLWCLRHSLWWFSMGVSAETVANTIATSIRWQTEKFV